VAVASAGPYTSWPNGSTWGNWKINLHTRDDRPTFWYKIRVALDPVSRLRGSFVGGNSSQSGLPLAVKYQVIAALYS